MVANDEGWLLHKRVDELLHTLVTVHRKIPLQKSPEFHAYKGKQEVDWLEHPGIQKHKNRVPVQMEDVGILRMRKLVELIGDRRDDKTFDLTNAGFEFHYEHCKRASH